MAQFLLPLKDEACRGQGGEYYNVAYWKTHLRKLSTLQTHIGRDPVDPDDLISQADKVLRGQYSNDHLSSKVYAAASTLMRLCLQHTHPILEVAQNVIVVAPSSSTITVPGYQYELNPSETAGNIRERFVYLDGNPTGQSIRLTYLPREDYTASRNEHDAVTSDRGGDSAPVRFGILGGETFVTVPAYS